MPAPTDIGSNQMETNTNTDYRRRWRLCEDAVDAIEFALAVNAENGEEVGFRLVRDARGAMLEADSPHDALDASDYISRESEMSEFMDAVHMRYDVRRIRRDARIWQGANE